MTEWYCSTGTWGFTDPSRFWSSRACQAGVFSGLLVVRFSIDWNPSASRPSARQAFWLASRSWLAGLVQVRLEVQLGVGGVEAHGGERQEGEETVRR